ncbi:hypothetical protein BASA83_007027 [Batrachochytrium salamandrivorans]|nr:hypothetical protein BASA83_007027 [Batrachochytrium salamandrivorans]
MGVIKHLDIIPSIDPSLSSSEFVVEAGWGTPSSIVGVIRLSASKPLKEAKLILEFQGSTATFWVSNKIRKANDPPGEAYSRQFQLISTVVRNSKDALEPNEFGSVTIPFTIHLPPQNLPPSYSDDCGCINYILKSTLSWSEAFYLTRPTRVATVPITIIMPRFHRLKLLRNPSTLEYDTPYSVDRCTCAIRLPSRVYIPGQQFTVQFAIPYIPPNRTIVAVRTTIEVCTTYRSITSDATKRSKNAVVWSPSPLASSRDRPSRSELDALKSSHPPVFSRSIQLVTDPNAHHPTLESPIITLRSIFKLKVFLDGDDSPHLSFETAIVVIPADTIKETASLKALEIARDQVLPTKEPSILAATSTSSLRSKRSICSTISSTVPPFLLDIPDSGGPFFPSYISGGDNSTLHNSPCSPETQAHSITKSSTDSIASLNSLTSGPPPLRYSLLLRDMDLQPSQTNMDHNPDDLTPITPESTSTLAKALPDIAFRLPLSRELASLPENTVATFENNLDAGVCDGNSELDGLLTIDELASRLTIANLNHKDFEMMMIPKSKRFSDDSVDSGKSDSNGALARLDSGISWAALPVNVDLTTSPSRCSNLVNDDNVLQEEHAHTLNQYTINTTQSDNVNTLFKNEDAHGHNNNQLSLHTSDIQNTVRGSASSQEIEGSTVSRHSLMASNTEKVRLDQMNQIDALLNSLLTLDQDTPTTTSDHDSQRSSPSTMCNSVPAVVVPRRSSSTFLSISRGLLPIGHNGAAAAHLSTPLLAQRPPSSTLSRQKSADSQLSDIPSQSQYKSFESLNMTGYSHLEKKPKAIARFSVIKSHSPQQPDELLLFAGDMVCIREVFRDGWCWGYHVLSKAEGSFPMRNVQLYDSVRAMG